MTGPDLLVAAVALCDQAGSDEQIEVVMARGDRTSVKAYDGEIEALTVAGTSGVGVRVVRDGRQGFAHAGSFDPSIVADVLAEARDNCGFAEMDPDVGLPEPDGVEAPDLQLWSDDLAEVAVDAKLDLAIELERRVRLADSRISGVRTASYGDSMSESAIASTAGVRATDRASFCTLGVQALARQGRETQTGYGFDVSRDFAGLSVDRAVDDAVDRAVRLLGATQPDTERLTVVLEARIAASLMAVVGGMLTGTRVAKGRTPFADRLGETVASPLVSLSDDPTDHRSFAADRFDGEGLASRRTDLVAHGQLRAFLHDTWSARRLGAASTASAVRGTRSTPAAGFRALVMAPDRGSLAELVAGVDRGILVQSVSGLHSGVNAVSGDFSVGIEGMCIVDGQLAQPFREATMASTVQRLLSEVVAVGGEIEWQPGGTGACAMVVADVAVSGR